MRAVMDNIRSALHSLIDGETHEPPVCTSLRILSLQCLCAHAHHYCCMSGSTIQHPEQQKAESQNLSTSLYPHTHARCHQRAYCSSTSSVAQSDVVVCDRAFLEQSMPIERRSGRQAPSVNAAGKLRRVRKRRCRSQARLELIAPAHVESKSSPRASNSLPSTEEQNCFRCKTCQHFNG